VESSDGAYAYGAYSGVADRDQLGLAQQDINVDSHGHD
jgi:hypothetical protein